MRKFIGTMAIKSGGVVCSDPCYASGTWCADRQNALNGVYNVYIVKYDDDIWGSRNSLLEIIHTNFDKKDKSMHLLWEDGGVSVGVDSGTFGFFDREYYDKYHKGDNENVDSDDAWYDKYICGYDGNERLIENLGVWSQSGFGDGSYWLEFIYHPTDDCIVGARAVFIDDETAWEEYEKGDNVPPTKDMWRFEKEEGDTSWFEFEKLQIQGGIIQREIDHLMMEAQEYNVSEENFEDLENALNSVANFKKKMGLCKVRLEEKFSL